MRVLVTALLACVFFLAVLPYGLARRVFAKIGQHMKSDQSALSYWQKHRHGATKLSDLRGQR